MLPFPNCKSSLPHVKLKVPLKTKMAKTPSIYLSSFLFFFVFCNCIQNVVDYNVHTML